MGLKERIETALERTSNQGQVSPKDLRKRYAEELAEAVKAALREWISAGVSVPQDGGASLKATLLAKIETL